MLTLGAQPEVWRLSDDPLSPAFWQSHYWAGVAVTGLMLFSLAARPEILRDLRLRRLHVTASVLAALLFVMQGITGTRDLLEIPLSWQKPAVYACDFALAALSLSFGRRCCAEFREDVEPGNGRKLGELGRRRATVSAASAVPTLPVWGAGPARPHRCRTTSGSGCVVAVG